MAREHSASQPIGVASIGSNDIHLLVAVSDGATRFDRLLDRSAEVELIGAEVEAGGHSILPAAALAGALGVLDDLVARARSAGAGHILAVGTEALREAANGTAFCALLGATFGIEAVIITGEEEAGLDYTWATFPAPPESPLLVVDSGGGSTQVIVSQGPAVSAISLPIGAENLTRRFIAHDPPKARELEALRAHVAALLDQLPALDLDASSSAPPAAILMGGSADHLATMSVHPKQRRLSLSELDTALAVAQRKPAAKLAREYKLPDKPERLVAAGAIILSQVLSHYGVGAAQVKADGIRGGLIVRYARHGGAWRADLRLDGTTGAPDGRTTAASAPHATHGKRSRPARE